MAPEALIVFSPRPDIWQRVAEELTAKFGYLVLFAAREDEANELIRRHRVNMLIAEEGDGVPGLALLKSCRVPHPDIVRTLILAPDAVVTHNMLHRAAIYQYLRRPFDDAQLFLVVQRALETRELARRHRLLAREFKVPAEGHLFAHPTFVSSAAPTRRFDKLVYVSDTMDQLCAMACKAAGSDLPILVQGETGTGKEVLARAIHGASDRSGSPLMVQNCGGMPDELIRSELFGHIEGGISGAVSARLGLFRAADGGTVFLDEIAEISPAFQIGLLRFLQSGEVKPLGSDTVEHSNVRIIASTNRPLEALVEAGTFRKDLYFRLKGFELNIPPLRERPEDICVLAEHFLRKYAQSAGAGILGFSASALERLVRYPFPGNVRELETEIRRMVTLARDSEYLTTADMSELLQSAPARIAASRLGPSHNGYEITGDTLHDMVEQLERHCLRESLARNRWNQSRTAQELGLSRVGLANKIKRFGLEADHAGRGAA